LLYNAADVTVAPSYSEGAPLVTPESLACGTPLIATNVGGNPEYLAKVDLNDLLIELKKYDFSEELYQKIALTLEKKYDANISMIPSWNDFIQRLLIRLDLIRGEVLD
jgi:glycosyltransferase involved in cell wall biosynthesis